MGDAQTLKVLEALEERPTLLFNLLQELQGYRIASPWVSDEGSTRVDPAGDCVAQAHPEVSGTPPGRWTWWIVTDDVGVVDSEEDAQHAADAALEKQGYTLLE